MSNPFVKATKKQARARVAICGPSGAGKTYTALVFAQELAKQAGGRIALIDTEKASASLYADRFDFDTLDFQPPYGPERYVEFMQAAADAGYGCVVVDSLSHGWFAEGGVLDIVDSAGQKMGGNRFAGWSVGTPAQNALVSTIVGLPCHLVATMRSKQEWVLEQDGQGGQRPRRVGMAPQQRDGIEYEFTLVCDMDLDHKMVVSKSRVESMADRVVVKPGPKFALELIDFLSQGDPLATPGQREELNALKAQLLTAEARADAKALFSSRGWSLPTMTDKDAAEAIERLQQIIATSAGDQDTGDDTGPPADSPQEPQNAPTPTDTTPDPAEAPQEAPNGSGGQEEAPSEVQGECAICEQPIFFDESTVAEGDTLAHAACALPE